MARVEEVLVPLALPRERIADATHVRGSVLLSSLRSLRAIGQSESYAAKLSAARREEVLGLTAGQWYPMDLALDHYGACDQLQLSEATISRIGAESGTFLNASVISVLLRLTREIGASPWAALANIERLRERLWIGGAFSVVKVGPKDARVEWYGQPCAQWLYYRLAFGAFMAGIMSPLSATIKVRTITRYCGRSSLGYAVSWV